MAEGTISRRYSTDRLSEIPGRKSTSSKPRSLAPADKIERLPLMSKLPMCRHLRSCCRCSLGASRLTRSGSLCRLQSGWMGFPIVSVGVWVARYPCGLASSTANSRCRLRGRNTPTRHCDGRTRSQCGRQLRRASSLFSRPALTSWPSALYKRRRRWVRLY